MKNLFNKFFLSYLFILLIPIISLGTLSFWWAGTILTRQTEQSYVAMTKELSNSVDQQLKQINSLSIQLSHTPWVKKIMYTEGTSFNYSSMNKIELNNHIMELKGYDITNDFIDTAALVFPRQQFIISSSGTEDSETFFNDIYHLKDYEYGRWQELLSVYGNKEILRPNILSYNGNDEEVLTYIQSLPAIDQKPHGFFLTFIKEKELNAKLRGFQISNDSSIYVLDKNNNLITSLSKEKELLSDIKGIKFSKDGNRVNNLIKINGKKYFVFYKISDVNQWRYVTVIPYNIVMTNINNMKIVTMIVAMLLSLLGLYLSYLFTTRNYEPLRNLVNIMKNRFSYKETVEVNEYDFLKKSIFLLLSEEDFLRKQAQKQKPLIINAAFLQFLNSGCNEGVLLEEQLSSLDIRFKYENYVVLFFVLDSIKGITNALSTKIYDKIQAFNGQDYLVEINGTKKAAILNTNDLNSVKDIAVMLRELLEQELSVKCSIGVGKAYNTLADIRTSYEEACNAVDYRLINDNSEIIFYEEISKVNNTYYYPFDKEVEILNGLRRGKYHETLKVIEEIIAMNVEADNMYLENGQCLLYDLIGTALKAINDLKINDLVTLDKNNIVKIQTLAELQDYLKCLCRKICDVLEENKTSHNDILKINILNYIDENINNANLSLDLVAESVNKSIPYVSKFFKEQIGCYFLDYLNRKRIGKAKELLNGQMTIAQIALLVGYNSDVAFRRVFKKYEGITPSEYIVGKNAV